MPDTLRERLEVEVERWTQYGDGRLAGVFKEMIAALDARQTDMGIPILPPPLHRLPNGEWVRLARVDGMKVVDAVGKEPALLEIVAGNKFAVLTFESHEAAQSYADELAGLVNEGRG